MNIDYFTISHSGLVEMCQNKDKMIDRLQQRLAPFVALEPSVKPAPTVHPTNLTNPLADLFKVKSV